MARELVHRGRKIEVWLDTTVLPDGTTVRRDMIVHPGAVVILPIVDAGPRLPVAKPPVRSSTKRSGSYRRGRWSRTNRRSGPRSGNCTEETGLHGRPLAKTDGRVCFARLPERTDALLTSRRT